MGLFDFIAKTKAVFENSEKSQKKFLEAKELAKLKKLEEAIKLGEEILSLWKENPSWREQIVREMSGGYLLENVKTKLTEWRLNLNKARHYINQGKNLIEQDKNDPFDNSFLTKALEYLEKSNEILYDTESTVTAQVLKDKINSRNKFQSLYQKGKNLVDTGFFKEGLPYLLDAQKIYRVADLDKEIIECEYQIKLQIQYENDLKIIKSLAQQGNFISAYNQLEVALDKFQRQDGNELKEKLRIVIDAKTDYRQGLMAEKIDNLTLAKKQYLSALSKLPQLKDASYRLALIDIKQHNFTSALSYLKNFQTERANYLRGFIYLQKNDYQNAVKEWKLVNNPTINTSKESLKSLIEREKIQIIKKIEDLVKESQYQEAKNYCQNFLKQYGYDPKIDHNLNKHIQPALQHQLWQSQNLIKIINQLEQEFKQSPNLTTLHNMAIALYYQAQLDENYIERWINCWMTVLLNINKSEVFQNISWLNINEINYEKIREDLIKIVEGAIDKYKDNNLDKYYQLRDVLRRENLALELMGNPPQTGIKIKQIFITPGFYLQHQTQLKSIQLKTDKLSTLFTNYGLAVAACLKNDTERAIKIKPSQQHSSGVEKLAYHLINYYEGCYYLQHHSWRKAKNPLEISQTEIKNNHDWVENINKLCEKQRQKIEDLKEHLEFAQFWYDLLKSNQSASYLAEFKAREISQQVADEKISFSQAINKLKDVQNIDRNNPLVIDLLSRLEYSREAEEIDKLLKQNRFEDAVRKARYSSNQEIKYLVASICVEIALKGAEARELDWKTLQQLGRWAYQICPHEPNFREVYRALKII
ncbi:peptidase M, neutral zinc metallopeptidase, zinc-binding site [Cyanobacterium aponinum]|uniref:Peptidase M, neutral zinc metallopeptidase, zinc-binding site n=1 Tax=Cyanobacterium aponinum 0216 TaxID=2676140 RepID=A0A844GUB4_9CHRO|nr:peptidase M, neutral zinc metallopeptidase, zinc-binding site [Cyanobacterium aponinum]MTF38641.1 peptidase M, neutral zinc metallopeptidase, zinc-binding site [Cyanobacterium aponinum 0216]